MLGSLSEHIGASAPSRQIFSHAMGRIYALAPTLSIAIAHTHVRQDLRMVGSWRSNIRRPHCVRIAMCLPDCLTMSNENHECQPRATAQRTAHRMGGKKNAIRGVSARALCSS